MWACGLGPGVGVEASTTLVIVPAGIDGGTATVTVALMVSPGIRSPTVQLPAAHGKVGVVTTETSVVPGGIVSASTTSDAVEGPSLVTVMSKTAWPPAVTVSLVATFETESRADWVIDDTTNAMSSLGSGSVGDDVPNRAVFTIRPGSALGSTLAIRRTTSVSSGSSDAERADDLAPGSQGAAAVRELGDEGQFGREGVDDLGTVGRRRPDVGDGDRVCSPPHRRSVLRHRSPW